MPSDGKGCAALADLLERLPPPEILEAQDRSEAMFRRFLASEKPSVTDSKHPFAFFVTEFGGLRISDDGPVTGAGGLRDYG